ncbi:MAG TPA: citrate synthase family protein [Gemmatimonadaceae bacterium]
MTAAAAVRALGVSRPTLYAYVSRGFLRSAPKAGTTRERLYSRDDVERLRRRAEERRDPKSVAAHALDRGTPLLESSITLIDGGHLYYRGHDAVEVSRTRSIAEVASLLWTRTFDTIRNEQLAAPAGRFTSAGDLPFLAHAQSTLAIAATRDPLAFDLRAEAVAASGGRILGLMTRAATSRRADGETIDEQLAAAWQVKRQGVDILRAALILCADHELNVSAFTARCVASAGATPYAAVIAGISALEGIRHGGLTVRVESMLERMRGAKSGPAALADWLRQGLEISGFGHPLYHGGDPRAIELFDLLRSRYTKSPELRFALDVADSATRMLNQQPSLDFALATVARVLGLPQGAGLTIFAIGRTIGWVGHAIEQYATGQLIRPRARYVGASPQAAQ